ncbi:MAG: efflux RND transporter periplasmic adaptor subunit [Longimicrobiales bacterium]|nr:efflux RND transporter periplasmic adaptor subunit [Longimicrobiales bacterium]
MNSPKQIVLSVSLVAAAAAVVAVALRSGAAPETQGGMEGHDMSTMAAPSGEMKAVVLDAEAARRIGVAYTTVERRVLTMYVKTVGNVVYDETRLATLNPKVEGWVEELHVNFTGAPVRAGQPLMEVYSPPLVSAQEELILAARLVREAGTGRAAANAEELLRSARRRLAYWDIPEDEIRRIEESGEPTKTLTLRSPASGVVVEKNVVEGDRIMPGMTLYRIADLSRVWIEAEVFEKDLAGVKHGQGALVFFEAYPGESFRGTVSYVYPTVSVQSRTARIRIELANPAGRLKPGMYATITLDVPRTEPVLVVPRSAVIETGQRTLVFVTDAGGALLPREIRTGRASGQLVEVLSGLAEGERIVSSAAFLVDAESSLGTMTGGVSVPAADTGAMPGMDHSKH